MATLQRNTLADNLVNKDLKTYEIGLRASLNLLEDLASQQASYEDFCKLRNEVLDDLGITISNLETEIKRKDLFPNQQKLNREFLKITNRFFIKIVSMRD